ncbi:MAG TPA: endonuclease III [Clostridiales bacterium]|nr:endonuclease III [Clostridiales bacterium]
MNRREMAAQTIRLLRCLYPDADCTLDFRQPWQLMAAAILAAQCTDARVNQITPALFARYPDLPALAGAEPAELENLIRSCGLFRTKARSILGASRELLARHQGEMPRTLEELIALPGVGRKIANLILGDSFGIPALVVDTHCARLSNRIGLTDQKDPAAIEKDLAAIVPEPDQIAFGHLMVSHGRAVCIARRPNCLACPLAGFCRSAGNKGAGG